MAIRQFARQSIGPVILFTEQSADPSEKYSQRWQEISRTVIHRENSRSIIWNLIRDLYHNGTDADREWLDNKCLDLSNPE